MQDSSRFKLVQLIRKYGVEVCDDPRRCRGYLADTIGSVRDVNLLSAVVRARVVEKFLSSSQTLPFQACAHRYAAQISADTGISEDLALWAVESWALALGVVSEEELSTGEEPEYRTGAEPADLSTDEPSSAESLWLTDLLDSLNLKDVGSNKDSVQSRIDYWIVGGFVVIFLLWLFFGR